MSDCDDFVPSDIENAANEAILTIVPEKSKLIYEACYKNFDDWFKETKMETVNEKLMLAYFMKQSAVMKPPTMWSQYSKLRTTIYLHKNIDISKFTNLIAFLKRKSSGYIGKKSKILTHDDIEKFLINADDKEYLLMKIVAILGLSGACRRVELVKMSIKDITDSGVHITVDIPETKNNKPRQFVITKGSFSSVNLLDIFRSYLALRKGKHDRFLVSYRSGKCSSQPVGINTIGSIPKKIATYLSLPNPELYTGHCFRRSSTTLLADSGADVSVLKRHGGWKSSSVAESYVENSLANKCKIARNILGDVSLNAVGTASASGSNVSTVLTQEVTIRQATSTTTGSNKSMPLPTPFENILSNLQGNSFHKCEINFNFK